MFNVQAIQPRMTGRRATQLVATITAFLAVPVIMYSFGANPPLGNSGSSTTSGRNWLIVMPPGGTTPVSETVGISAAVFAAGTSCSPQSEIR